MVFGFRFRSLVFGFESESMGYSVLNITTSSRMKHLFQFVGAAILLTVSAAFSAETFAQSPPNISVNGRLAADSVRRGSSAVAIVEMNIPSGFHVHSNRPLEKFLIATQLDVEAPRDVRVGRVNYPRAILRSLKFSKNRVAVYEGRAIMRFNVTVPASFGSDSAPVKAKLRYQSCNDELCFPPQTRDVWIQVKVR